MFRSHGWLALIRITFALSVATTIWLSVMPIDQLPSAASISDVLAHFVGYAILGILAIASGLPRVNALVVVFSLGVLLEIIQGFSGYRYFEVKDIVVNFFGALTGIIVAIYLTRAQSRWP